MAAKKVGFKPKPNNNKSGDVEKWVNERVTSDVEPSPQDTAVTPTPDGHLTVRRRTAHPCPLEEAKPKMKRLTIDVTEELHKAIKMKAVEQGTPMADMLRSLLESNYL